MRAPVKPGFLLLLLCAFASPPAAAFSADAHRIAGHIATHYLCDETRDWIAPLLEGATLADAGTWADAIRDDPAWRHAGPWHYINVGDDASIARAARASPDNVVAAIGRFERALADERLPRRERAEALRFLVHFIADVHQPLHVGRAQDRGGNEIDVTWGRENLSLHAFWDARGLVAGRMSLAERAEAIRALAVGQEGAWAGRTTVQWAEESRAYRAFVYDGIGARTPARLSPAYVAGARNIVEWRLAQAGWRIAERLNALACRPRGRPDARPSH